VLLSRQATGGEQISKIIFQEGFMAARMDPRTPVLVGVGVSQQKVDEPEGAAQLYQLMVEAVEMAAVDAGSEYLLADAERIYVPRGLWAYSDPARLIADDIGAAQAVTVMAEIGILQQTLLGDACRRIQAGELDIAIVAGGEAKYRQLRASIAGIELDDLEQQNVIPDITLTPEAELWSDIEANAGLAMPVGYYAIMESALRHARGESVDDNRDRLAAMYEKFSQQAVDNPHAWNRGGVTADCIRNPVGKNKMLAFPYTKYHNSQWNVDQAAGLIFCSVEKAEALGISRDKWVFPLASTESNHMINISQREHLHRSTGAEIAGQRALDLAGVSVDELKYLDMYSCFPAAVRIFTQALGIDEQRPLTITGGMTFAGGPLNNYVLQSTCRMAELLRADRGSKGLLTCVSGMITKQGFGLWSSEPNERGFQFADVTAEVAEVAPTLELVGNVVGQGSIKGYTVLFDGNNPVRAIAVIDLPDGKRTVVYSEQDTVLKRMMAEDLCGHTAILEDGQFSL
jgi:acetyl-CoA C-acetyltransferase